MTSTSGLAGNLTATGTVSTAQLVGGAIVGICKAGSIEGGAWRAIRSTGGREVLARPRLLISILFVVLGVLDAADNDDTCNEEEDDDDDDDNGGGGGGGGSGGGDK